MDEFSRQRGGDYQQAMNSAIAGGGAEQSRLFSLGQSARQQAIQEEEYRRHIPLNELNALMHGNQVTLPQFQQYQGGGNIEPPNYFAAAQGQFGAQRDLYNQQAATAASNTQGLYSLGGSLAGAGIGAAAIIF